MANVVLSKSPCLSREEIDKTVTRVLDSLNHGLEDNVDSVVIKPNLSYYWDYSTGETTDPRVVSAVVDWVRSKRGNSISICVAEADASAMRTKHAFKMLGYDKLSSEKNVELVNLSEGNILEREVPVAGKKLVLPVNEKLLTTDFLINVPKLKYHRTIGFTCALKNIFGAISKPYKYAYHKTLANTIVGMNKLVRTNIVLVDGIFVVGRTPKKLGALIAGNSIVASDFVAAKAMGVEPTKIEHLRLALREKIGTLGALNYIENPLLVECIRNDFPRPNYLFQKWSWKLELKMLKIYAKLAGDVVPPILWESDVS